VHAKGKQKSDVYEYLTEAGPKEYRGPIGWNFTKFLIDQDGKIVNRYPSHVDPDDPKLAADIQTLLKRK